MKAKDLAKKLGVSPATISLVLNNKPGISDSLRKSLLEQIQSLGCGEMLCESCREGAAPGSTAPGRTSPSGTASGSTAPGAGASSGQVHTCRSIAYIIYHEHDYMEDMNDPYNFFSGVLEGIEAEAWEHNYCLIMLHAGRYKKATLEEQLRRAGNVAGVIVHPCTVTDPIKETVRSLSVPCVFMDNYDTGSWQPPSVCVSNRQGMRHILGHLTELGHRRIGYVCSGWESLLNQERRRCFREVLGDLGMQCADADVFTAGQEVGIWDCAKLTEDLRRAGSLPTALVCENDRQAWRAIKALQSIGLRVPEDVSVAGFDDGNICTSIEPNITTVHNSPQLMGRQCVLMLKNLLRLKDLGEEPWLRYELPAALVVRDSTGPVRQAR